MMKNKIAAVIALAVSVRAIANAQGTPAVPTREEALDAADASGDTALFQAVTDSTNAFVGDAFHPETGDVWPACVANPSSVPCRYIGHLDQDSEVVAQRGDFRAGREQAVAEVRAALDQVRAIASGPFSSAQLTTARAALTHWRSALTHPTSIREIVARTDGSRRLLMRSDWLARDAQQLLEQLTELDGLVAAWAASAPSGTVAPSDTVAPSAATTAVDPAQVTAFMVAYDARIAELLTARGVEWHDTAAVPAGRSLRDQRLAIVDATVRVALPAILDAVPNCHECQRVAAELRLLPDLRSPERMARFRQAALLARDGRAREAAPSAWFRWLHGALAEAADAATDDVTAIERTALTIARPLEAGTRAESDVAATSSLATNVVTTAATWDGTAPPPFRAAQPTYITADDVDAGHRYADRSRAIACESVRPYLAIALDQLPAATATAHDRVTDFGYVALDGLVRVVLAAFLDDLGLDESAARLRRLAAIRGAAQARAASTFIESGFIRAEYDRSEGMPAIHDVFEVVDSVANAIGPPSIWAHASEAQSALELVMQERLPQVSARVTSSATQPTTEFASVIDIYTRLLGVGATR